ncbi:MAG: Dyp-type peroxidase [Pseudorhodoplanes sp.]
MPDLNNIQAIIARSSTKPSIAVLLFRLGEPAAAKHFLTQWISSIPAGHAPDVAGTPALHMMFSWRGIETLLRGHAELDADEGQREIETFFVDPGQSPANLAPQLGFLDQSQPGQWWSGRFASGDIDLAIHVSCDDDNQRADVLDRLRVSAIAHGLAELTLPDFTNINALSGFRPAGGILHFGYRDGITTPDVDWGDTAEPGKSDFREFVVGYPNDDYPVPPQRPGPWQDFARDGSYAALAWIHQDVATFNRFLADHAPLATPHADPAAAVERLAAKLMGRWRDGSPISKYPDSHPATPRLENDFSFRNDPVGAACPLTAHIRVVNCRDQPMSFPNQMRFGRGAPRLIRRGFSYGPPLNGETDDGADRGLVGVFFCARVNEQFYTVLRWIQKTDFSDDFESLPHGLRSQDGLFGNRSDPNAQTNFRLVRPAREPVDIPLKNFITYKGVVVLFAPSVRSLATLAA